MSMRLGSARLSQTPKTNDSPRAGDPRLRRRPWRPSWPTVFGETQAGLSAAETAVGGRRRWDRSMSGPPPGLARTVVDRGLEVELVLTSALGRPVLDRFGAQFAAYYRVRHAPVEVLLSSIRSNTRVMGASELFQEAIRDV